MKLWNYKVNDLRKNGLPTCAWRRQPSHQLEKVYEGRRPDYLLNSRGTVLNLQLRPSYWWGYFKEMCNKLHWILQRIYRLKVCNPRAFALSMRCRLSRSHPRVFHETITVISLWRHNGCPWDNEESIATHSNAIPRPMGCITIYMETRAYGYHIRKTRAYGYHIRKTKSYGYADHVGCIRVDFGQSTG